MAISGAGILPFMTPTSMIWRGSTCPSKHGAVQTPAAIASASGASPTAPLNESALVDSGNPGHVPATIPFEVAGSPGTSALEVALKTPGNCVPGLPSAISFNPDRG